MSNKQNNWKERIDELVIELLELYNLYRGQMKRAPYLKLEVGNDKLEKIKFFIEEILQAERNRIAERLEGMKIREGLEENEIIGEKVKFYNEALTEAIKVVRDNREK